MENASPSFERLSCEELRRRVRQFEANAERLEALVAGLTPEQAAWRPAPKRWSVVECLDHLRAAGAPYQDPMAALIERGRREGRTGSSPYGRGTFVGRLLVAAVDPEKMRKAKAPRAFRPAPAAELDLASTIDALRGVQRRWPELAAAADGLDLGRLVLATPVSRFIRVTLAQAFEVHALHEARHLAQAERVTAEPAFPGMSAQTDIPSTRRVSS